MNLLRAALGFALLATAAAAAEVGAPAPAWHLTSLDGREVSSTTLKGKVVILDFWATWCGPCKKEIPAYMALQRKYGDQGLVIVGVSMDSTPGPVKKYVADNQLNYVVGMTNDEVYRAFNSPDAIPTTVLIDRGGVIRDIKLGGVNPAVYEKRVQQALKG